MNYTLKPLVWHRIGDSEYTATVIGRCTVSHLERPDLHGRSGWVVIGPMQSVHQCDSREHAKQVVDGWHKSRLMQFLEVKS